MSDSEVFLEVIHLLFSWKAVVLLLGLLLFALLKGDLS